MPRFFFHLNTGSDVIADETGLDLPEAGTSVSHILRAVSELMSEEPLEAAGVTSVDVCNESGRSLLKIPLSRSAAA